MGRNYRNIIAWQKAHGLTLDVYKATKQFPSDERFGLVSLVRRAAYSAPANIVEGSSRDTLKDYLRFLHIAWASLKEVEYFLLLSKDLGYLEEPEHTRLTTIVDGVFSPLRGLVKSVEAEP